jgi:hypothetical protein
MVSNRHPLKDTPHSVKLPSPSVSQGTASGNIAATNPRASCSPTSFTDTELSHDHDTSKSSQTRPVLTSATGWPFHLIP